MNQNVDVNNNLDEEDTSTYSYFWGCQINKYKKGLFVNCPGNHPDYGEKYYHNGWWNQEREGWFFKLKCECECVNECEKMHPGKMNHNLFPSTCFFNRQTPLESSHR